MGINYGCGKRYDPLKIVKMDWTRSIVGSNLDIGFFGLGLVMVLVVLSSIVMRLDIDF